MKIDSENRLHPWYLLAYDPVDEDKKIYGMMELDLHDIDIDTLVSVQFFNDDGKIDLQVREINQSEYKTYEAFELFPILTPYDRQDFPFKPDTCSFDWGIDFHTAAEIRFKVKFRDY